MPKRKGPGKSHRRGMPLFEAVKLLSDEEKVEQMFVEIRWPGGVCLPELWIQKGQDSPNP